MAGAAHPGFLRGPIPDQSPPPLWSPHPLGWGLLQGWSCEDHDRRQSSEHWQERQGGTGEEFIRTFSLQGAGSALVETGSTVDRLKALMELTPHSEPGTLVPSPFFTESDPDSTTPRNTLIVSSLRGSNSCFYTRLFFILLLSTLFEMQVTPRLQLTAGYIEIASQKRCQEARKLQESVHRGG